MTQQYSGSEGGSGTVTVNGTVVPAGSGESAVVVALGSGSTLTYSTAEKIHGSQAFQLNPAANQICSLRSQWSLGNALSGATDCYFKNALAAPGSGISEPILQVRASGGNLLTVSRLGTTGNLRVAGSTQQDYTYAFNPQTAKRIGLAWNIDAANPANSQYRLGVFGIDSDALLFDTGFQTITPTTTGVGAENVAVGRIGTNQPDTSPVYIDDFRTVAVPSGVTADLIPTLGELLPVAAVSPATADVGASPSVTITTTRGNANAKEYAIKIEFSAKGDWTDTTVYQDFPSGAWSASPNFTFTPPTKGSYRVIPRARQQPVG